MAVSDRDVLISYRRRERVIAVMLTALAGYVDALGFLELGGYFISFMSGNSTRFGVGIERGFWPAAIPAMLIGLFVLGVIAGSVVGRFATRRRRVRVLALVTGLLAGAAVLAAFDFRHVAIVAMVLAMGAENTVFERNGEVSLGLTYMTGTLVKLGQRLTAAWFGEDRWAWSWYLLLWLGLVAGTIGGAVSYVWIGLGGLWLAALVAGLLTLAVARWAHADITTAQVQAHLDAGAR